MPNPEPFPITDEALQAAAVAEHHGGPGPSFNDWARIERAIRATLPFLNLHELMEEAADKLEGFAATQRHLELADQLRTLAAGMRKQ